MTGRVKTAAITLTAAAALLILIPAAHAQMGKKGSHAAPSTDTKPRVDEKAYKPYDPWGQVHDSEPAAKSSGKPN
jgi:hypothetical protein